MSEQAKPPTAPIDTRKREERRKFLQTCGLGAGVVGFSLLGFEPVLTRRPPKLRPPGALEEHDFLAACIKCGQCVQVCPVNALKPGDLTDGFGVGAPLIEPRAQACDFSCDVAQCILACPTGALTYQRPDFAESRPGALLPAAPVLLAKRDTPDPTLNFRERMGAARLSRPDACLSVRFTGVHGTARGDDFTAKHRYPEVDRWAPVRVNEHPYELERCDLCVRECPIERAISIEPLAGADGVTRPTPVVHEACVGCGACEMMCPAEPPAIVIDARAEWKGGQS